MARYFKELTTNTGKTVKIRLNERKRVFTVIINDTKRITSRLPKAECDHMERNFTANDWVDYVNDCGDF